MNSKMLQHLSGRPIAPIVNPSTEKHSTVALQMMCILDYELEVSGMYPKIKKIPKLMTQLLNIHSFAKFKYFKYNLAKEVEMGFNILKCKRCELIAPYVVILEHMAISHDVHSSAKMCMWCEKNDFQDHILLKSLDACYKAYLVKNQFSSSEYYPVIVEFYELLKNMAKSLGAETMRRKDFRSAMVDCRETIALDNRDDSMDSKIIVSKPMKRTYKGIDVQRIEKLYGKAMTYFYKQNAHEYIGTTTTGQTTPDTTQSTANLSSRSFSGNTPAGSTVFARPGSSTAFNSPNSTTPFDMPSSTLQFAPLSPLPTPPPIHLPSFQPLSTFNIPSPESDFAYFISSVLNNIQNEALKNRAKLEIKQIIYKYSAQDVAKQLMNDTQSDDLI